MQKRMSLGLQDGIVYNPMLPGHVGLSLGLFLQKPITGRFLLRTIPAAYFIPSGTRRSVNQNFQAGLPLYAVVRLYRPTRFNNGPLVFAGPQVYKLQGDHALHLSMSAGAGWDFLRKGTSVTPEVRIEYAGGAIRYYFLVGVWQ